MPGMDPEKKPSLRARIVFLALAIPFFYLVYRGILWFLQTVMTKDLPVPKP